MIIEWKYGCFGFRYFTYECEKIEELLTWYKENWENTFLLGGCDFDIYEGERRLTYKEEYDLGFHGNY